MRDVNAQSPIRTILKNKIQYEPGSITMHYYFCALFYITLLYKVTQICSTRNVYPLTFSRLMTYSIYMSHRTANLQMLHFIYLFNKYSTEYFKHAAHSLFFPLQNAVYFIMLPFLVPVLFTF